METENKIQAIKVKDLDYLEVNLMIKYKNKPLLLLFYNNACLGCTGRAIPLAHKFKQDYKKIQVVGIHVNFGNAKTTKEEIKSIFTINNLPFPIYLDETKSVYDSFKCEGTPHWVIINKQGDVYRSIFGSQYGAQNRLYYAIESLINET
ncbi:TlpA family protein disulfide reductase [Pontimicrobium sp. MEBiC06410]|jgi:peroxiredoxin